MLTSTIPKRKIQIWNYEKKSLNIIKVVLILVIQSRIMILFFLRASGKKDRHAG